MSDGRPWDVPEDLQYILWLIRRARRLIMRVEGEPERKGRGGKRSAVAFQQQVMDEMERYGRYPMTGPLALDLHFTAARRNPASIHHIAKHALDILGVVLPGNERPRRRSVLYRDDRQVKFLYVDLNPAWQPDGEEGGRTGSTFIIAQRARDVMADFCMAGRLDRERLYEDEESPFVVPDLPDGPEPDWLTAPGSVLTATERFFAEETRFHDTRSLQDALLARTDALLISALSMYLDHQPPRVGMPEHLAAILEESEARSRNLLLSNPLMLPLPGLPRVSGESRDFAQLIRDSMQAFRSRWPVYRTLLTPVTLTFLVIPPKQGKDLDNIALTALPIAHQVLKPHIEPHLLVSSYGKDWLMPWQVEALDRLRSVNAQSVSAYQVIELPRSAHDAPEGSLRLALGRHSYESWWERVASYLDKGIDEAEKRGELGSGTWKSVLTRW